MATNVFKDFLGYQKHGYGCLKWMSLRVKVFTISFQMNEESVQYFHDYFVEMQRTIGPCQSHIWCSYDVQISDAMCLQSSADYPCLVYSVTEPEFKYLWICWYKMSGFRLQSRTLLASNNESKYFIIHTETAES